MIKVSTAWKEAHKQMLLPETYVEITLSVSDLEAANMTTVTCTNGASFSNTGVIVNRTVTSDTKYALLERNLWSLDGSKSVIPSLSTYEAPGYASSTSIFGTLTISLSEVRTVEIPGFTITWSSEYDDYATDFTITVKNGGTTVVSKTVTGNNSNVSSIEMPCSNYDTVVITVSGWSLPDRRMRVDSVMFGYMLIFDKNQIISYTHEQTGDPIGTELPKNSIDFSIDNSDGRWNPLNPIGYEKYLCDRQSITVRYGMDINGAIEWIKGGTFYLTGWKSSPNGLEASFSARDALEFMLGVPYGHDGITATVTTSSTNIYSTAYDNDSVVRTLRAGDKITVKSFVMGEHYFLVEEGYIPSTSVSFAELGLDDRFSEALAEVELPSDFVIEDNISGNAPWAVEPTTVANYIQMCANACGCSIWQTRDNKLMIGSIPQNLSDYVINSYTSYSHPEVELTKPLRKVKFLVGTGLVDQRGSKLKPYEYTVNCGTSGEDLIVDNPLSVLSHYDNKIKALRLHRNAWRYREVVSGDFRADPRLDLFDIVTVETQYGTISPVLITSIKYTYNGGFRGTYTGRRIALDNRNLVSSSENMTDAEVYNGVGYKNGTYISDNSDGEDPSCVATGWIVYQWRIGVPLYIRGAEITTDRHVRFYGYESKTSSPTVYATGNNLSTYFDMESWGTDGYILLPKSDRESVGYIRMSLIGTGENLVVR